MNGRFIQPPRIQSSETSQESRSVESGAKATSLRKSPGPLEDSPSSRSKRLATDRWEERLGQLQSFKERHGHCNVPRGWPENPSLSYWVINQRYKLRKGTLPQDRIRRLQVSGISWVSAADRIESRAQSWARMFSKLATFKNTDVESGGRPNRKLARWLANQRYLMRTGTLPEDRRRKLEGLGMLWNIERGRSRARDKAWEHMYSEAKKFKNRIGRGDATCDRATDPRLVRWIAYQRHRLDRETLLGDRRRRFLELGLERHPARVREQAWQRMYGCLKEYRRIHGHCLVPRSCPENPRLGRWVSHQRYLKRYGRLPQARIESLEALGLEWSAAPPQNRKSESRWDRRFRSLLSFKTAHGHTRVPRHSNADRELADWVARQRRSRRMNRLSPERIAKLTGIGFEWDPRWPLQGAH